MDSARQVPTAAHAPAAPRRLLPAPGAGAPSDPGRFHLSGVRDRGTEPRRSRFRPCPGSSRLTLDRLLPVAERCLKLGIPALALFPAIEPALKTPDGHEAANPDGLIPRQRRALKKAFPELGVMTDVALDPYTSHGQDGVIDDTGYILNDETIAILQKQALTQARGGRRHRGAFGHDGWTGGRAAHRARRGALHLHADHGLLGEVRFGVLRAVP